MNKANNDPSKVPQVIWLSVAGASFLIVAIILVVSQLGKNDSSNETIKRQPGDPAQGLKFLSIATVANGFLEDESEPITGGDGEPLGVNGYDEANFRYRELIKELPDEQLPRRNLAISLLLYYINTTEISEKKQAEVLGTAYKRIDELIEFETGSGVGHWLKAQLINKENSGDTPESVAELLKACDTDPTNPVFFFSLYEASKLNDDLDIARKSPDALAKCFSLVPNNLKVITDLMVLQSQNDDPKLADTLAHSKDVLLSLKKLVLRNSRADVEVLISELESAVAKGDWQTSRFKSRILQNVIKNGDIFHSDVSKVKPYPLDFMLHRLSDDFYRHYSLLGHGADESLPVAFNEHLVHKLDGDEPIIDFTIVDFDLNGLDDVLVLTKEKLFVYSISQNGNEPLVIQVELGLQQEYRGILVADLDRDVTNKPTTDPTGSAPGGFEADADVVLWGDNGISVLRNELDKESGQRSLVAQEQTLQKTAINKITNATLVDIDHDSDLDIVAVWEDRFGILLHTGEMQFEDYSQWIVNSDEVSGIGSLTAVDWNRDVDIDIVVGGLDGKAVGYLENLRHGRFRYQPLGETFEPFQAGRSLSVCEIDGNASWDLVGCSDTEIAIGLTTTLSGGNVDFLKQTVVSAEKADGVLPYDFDNDGDHDVLAWNDRGLSLYECKADNSFLPRKDSLRSLDEPLLKVETSDWDNDGDLDIVAMSVKGLVFVENEGGDQNGWLSLRAFGQWDNKGRCNHFGIGSLTEVKCGARYQAQTVSGQKTHFGLGKKLTPDTARIVWTNGMPQAIIQPSPSQSITEVMFLKGSCPFIYAWDGEKYAFVTDCLWAAPIGLQVAEGVTVPTRSWEYLKIPGEKLQPINGQYRLQLTEELWEAAYFDQVELIAIDHPQDVEIFSNEKVGPPDISQFQIHTVLQRRSPVAARNMRGENVMEQVEKKDSVFFKGFQQKLRQGLTPEHYLEIDLGELNDPKRLTLFLTGWIQPTDTSLNIAFSQAPEVNGPTAPQVWIPDEQGTWRQVPTPMGFPGGKTKTIAVDLSQAFPGDDYRLRIKTTAEIYWDEVFFTVNEGQAELQQQPINVASASLHYRGFSARFPRSENGPELFDYQKVTSKSLWPPMRGNFTRYGDVTSLLNHGDDMMVVMGSGDEMTVAFDLPANPTPKGWKRDFFLHCVGWDKDADLNTIYGQTVEPLPFRGMSQYPYAPQQVYPDTQGHQEYLGEFQTRKANWTRFWKQVHDYDSALP